MATRAVVIQARDMIAFLEERKFKRIEVPGTKELVFARRIDYQIGGFVDNAPTIIDTIPLSLRVFTSIAVTGKSRALGKDAIRVVLLAHYDGAVFPISSERRVHRVEGWRDNLSERLESIRKIEHVCPLCAAPMLLRTPKFGGKQFTPFYGCMRFRTAGCRGNANAKEKYA